MTNWMDRLLDISPLIAVGMIGAALQCFKSWSGWRNFIASITTSGFGAFLFGELARGMGWSEGVAFFAAGMIGYSGGTLVDAVLQKAKQQIDEIQIHLPHGGRRNENDREV